MEGKQDIWVWIEGGTGRHTGLELITPGRELAGQLKGTLTAVVIGCLVEEAILEAASCGVDKIVAIDDQAYMDYQADRYTEALRVLVERHHPSLVVAKGGKLGRADFWPRNKQSTVRSRDLIEVCWNSSVGRAADS